MKDCDLGVMGDLLSRIATLFTDIETLRDLGGVIRPREVGLRHFDDKFFRFGSSMLI